MSEEQKKTVEEAIETVLGEEQEAAVEVEAELVEPEVVDEQAAEVNEVEELTKKLALS